jgi:hypothetical protein
MQLQLTWLDLLAANMGAMLWLWGLVNAVRWWRTEEKKLAPAFITCSLIGLAFAIFLARAEIWFEVILTAPIVPPLASQ